MLLADVLAPGAAEYDGWRTVTRCAGVSSDAGAKLGWLRVRLKASSMLLAALAAGTHAALRVGLVEVTTDAIRSIGDLTERASERASVCVTW